MLLYCSASSITEPSVRAEIVDHIPHIADYCCSNSSELDGLTEALSVAILPSLVRCLHDNDNQVCKYFEYFMILLCKM